MAKAKWSPVLPSCAHACLPMVSYVSSGVSLVKIFIGFGFYRNLFALLLY